MAFIAERSMFGKGFMAACLLVMIQCNFLMAPESKQHTGKCGVYLAEACRDTLVWTADSGYIFAWDPQKKEAYGAFFENRMPSRVYVSVYTERLLKDTTYWFNVETGDSNLFGYSVFAYYATGILQKETQYNAGMVNGVLTSPVTIRIQNHDEKGRVTRRMDIFNGVQAVVYEMNKLELPRKKYVYFLDDPVGTDGDTTWYYYQEKFPIVLKALSNYKGPVLLDSTNYDIMGREIKRLEFHGEGWVERIIEFAYANPTGITKLEIRITIYDSPGHVLSISWTNGDGYLTHFQDSTGQKIKCAEPLELDRCKNPLSS